LNRYLKLKCTHAVPWEIIMVVLFTFIVYCLKNLGDPIHEGRDFWTYNLYFNDLLNPVPSYPVLMLFRTPVAPVIFGVVFAFGKWWVVQGYFLVTYVISALIIWTMVTKWSRVWGWIAVIVFWLASEYFHLFNSVASEHPTAFFGLIWVAFAYHIRSSIRFSHWIILALFTFMMVLIRPNHQVLGLVLLMPFFWLRTNLRRAFFLSAAAMSVLGICLIAYCGYNYSRYGCFEVAHLGPAHNPFYRLFIHAKMIRPENGPESEKLANFVREEVLAREVFRTYCIDEETFWKASTPRFWIHIVDALNRKNGYQDNNSILSKVSLEAMLRYPLVFWFSYFDELRVFFECSSRPALRPRKQIYVDYPALLSARVFYYRQLGLDIPTEDDLIPGGVSQLKYPENQASAGHGKDRETTWRIKPGRSNLMFARIFHLAGYIRPSISVFLLLSFLAGVLSWRTDRDFLVLLSLNLIILLMLCATAMANPELQFRFPYDPVFILTGCIAFSITMRPRMGEAALSRHE